MNHGDRFGRLTVESFDHTDKFRNRCYLCSCDCGNSTVVKGSSLTSGRTKSCGCLRREITAEKEQNISYITVISDGLPEKYSMTELARKAGCSVSVMYNRLKKSRDLSELLRPTRSHHYLPAVILENGAFSTRVLAEMTGLPRAVIDKRVKLGWPEHRLLNPVGSK